MKKTKGVKKLVDSYQEAVSSKTSQISIPKTDSFTDSHGTVWVPKITTPVLVETCRETGLTIADLFDFNINVADLFEALWISCRTKATELKISKEIFMERVTPDILTMAFSAYWTKLSACFPSMHLVDKMNGGPTAGSGPLEPGK